MLRGFPKVSARFSVTIFRYNYFGRSFGSSCVVGIATSYDLDGQCSMYGIGKKFFFSPQRPDLPWCPPSLPYNGYQMREADHSPSSSVDVRNDGVIPPLPHTFSWCGPVFSLL
jgi:hypothetical protein